MNIQESIHTSLSNLRRSERTIQTYTVGLDNFKEFLGDQCSADISTLKFQSFIDYVLQMSLHVYAKSTIQTYLAAVTYFLKWLMIRDMIQPTPNDMARFDEAKKDVVAQRQKRKKKVPSGDTVSKLLDAAYTQKIYSPVKERDIAVLLFMLSSGARVSDVVYISVKDIDFVNHKANVIGKGDKERSVWFSPEAAEAIQAYWQKRKWSAPDDPAFANHSRIISTRHVPMEISAVETILRRICALAGIEGVTPHSLRHYFVTDVVRNTDNVFLAQQLAGHESIATTRGYTELDETEIDEAYTQYLDKRTKSSSPTVGRS